MAFESVAEDLLEIFHHQDNIFITTKYEITATQLQRYFMEQLSKDKIVYPKGTTFYFIVGFHHSRNAMQDGKPGPNDDGLVKDFEGVIENLKKFCGSLNCKFCKIFQCWKCASTNPPVWKRMAYKYEAVELSTKRGNEKETYELTEHAINKLKGLSKRLCKQDGPSTFVFASCYSYFSIVSQILRAKGIISVAQLVKDLLEVTEGKVCWLDEQQLKVFTNVNEVR